MNDQEKLDVCLNAAVANGSWTKVQGSAELQYLRFILNESNRAKVEVAITPALVARRAVKNEPESCREVH
jgi:hypothetical protein